MYSPHSWMLREPVSGLEILNSLAQFWFLTVPGSVLFLICLISLSISVLSWLSHPKPHLTTIYWILNIFHLAFKIYLDTGYIP